MPLDFETFDRINRERQQEAERRNEQLYAEMRERRQRDEQRQHEQEMSEVHHGSNAGLILTVGVLSLSRRLRHGFGVLVLTMIVGGFALTVLGTAAHELGVVGVIVVVFGALLGSVWLLASGLAGILRIAAEDIKRDFGGE